MTCPRCSGRMFLNGDEDRECVVCGCVAYRLAPMPIDQAKPEAERAHHRTHMSIRVRD